MRLLGLALFVTLLATPALTPAWAQDPALTLTGVIDIHVHQGPDSGGPREIDADDLARLAQKSGMRGLVMKNHWESTAAMAYLMRKQAPGLEIFGGVPQNLAVGGINVLAVRQMADIAGHHGRIVWLPTFDSEITIRGANGTGTGAFVPVQKNGVLLPSVLELFDVMGKQGLTLATGHISTQETLLVIPEARKRGVQNIIVTHVNPINVTVAQMQQMARDGAKIEFCYASTLGPTTQQTVRRFADAIRAVGAANFVISTDLGGTPRAFPRPMPPQGMLDFMNALRQEGISVADINVMAKTNPALLLGLKP
jgi:hypothetical protein